MAPKHERVFGVQRPIWHFWSAEQLGTFGQWPSSDDKAHPFQSFRKRMHLDSHPNRPCLFFRVLRPL